MAEKDSLPVPQNGFENYLEIKLGNTKVINEFIGEGQTPDNIISNFPEDKVLFGGCLIKKIGASKGYLGDANINAWSNTVSDVKKKYNEVKTIISGHGKSGGDELLDYTIELFKINYPEAEQSRY